MALTKAPSTSTSTPLTSTQLTLPPPQTFDILPALHELLARIDSSNGNSSGHHHIGDLEGEDPVPTRYAELQPLDPKQLPNEVLPLRAKIRRAQRELEKLPDMNRSVEEQRHEIAELERRIARQREMLDRMAQIAKEGMETVMGERG